MSATTIKIEDPLLSELRSVMPERESVSAFIREILEHDIERRKMRRAAEEYTKFLAFQKEERNWLGDWESTPLSEPPKPSVKRKTV